MLGPLDVACDVIEVLDRLTIDYALGGSLANSTFGEPRATNDVDLVLTLTPADLGPLVAEFRDRHCDVPEQAAAEAVTRRSSFNVVHPSGLKVDLFVAGDWLLDQLRMSRRVHVGLPIDPPRTIWITSPGDQILRKLDWYRLGQEVSDRQRRDIIGLLQAQGAHLDIQRLRSNAREAGLSELFERGLQETGIHR